MSLEKKIEKYQQEIFTKYEMLSDKNIEILYRVESRLYIDYPISYVQKTSMFISKKAALQFMVKMQENKYVECYIYEFKVITIDELVNI